MKLLFGPLMGSAGTGSPAPGAGNPEAALAATNAAATARLDALLTGGPEPIVSGSSAEPIPSPTPSSPQVVPPASAPGTPPVQVQGAPSTPPAGNEPAAAPGAPAAAPAPTPDQIQVKVADLDPAARAFLSRYGYDVDKALADALRNGNTIATLMKERRAGAWTPTTPGSTPGAPVQQAAETPLPLSQISPELIDTQARSLLDGDKTATTLMNRALEIRNERYGLIGEPGSGLVKNQDGTTKGLAVVPSLRSEIMRITASLELPEVQADSLKSQDLNMKLLLKQQELLRHENRVDALERNHSDVAARYRARYGEAVDHVRGQLEATYNEYMAREAETAEFNDAADTIVRVWPGAIQRAISDHNIGADQITDFQKYAKLHADAAPDEIEDIEGFVNERGKEFAEMTDRAHRARSQAFGHMATGRADAAAGVQPGAAPSNGAQAPAAPSNQPSFSSDPLRDVNRKVEEKWAALASGR